MNYDDMTGLPSIATFFKLAKVSRIRFEEQKTDFAILFFDLTDLKSFNRRYGFAEGNRLLCAVANILANLFGLENCARFAQDHFAAITPEEGLTEHLDAVIAQCAVANEGKTLPLRIGVYPNRIEAVPIDVACDRARLASNVWKNRTESHYSFFDMRMLEEEKSRQAIVDNLDRAIEEGWIQVYYQPIVRSINGKVCDVEALARWHDPVRGMLMPSTFIPVLEESMLIHKLDLCVVRQVLKHLKLNEEAGNHTVPVSINFSRADFEVYDLVSEICTLVDAAQVDRKLINIEITESIVGSDFDFMREQIDRFHEQGFQIWMDDFGSGYSSLDVLQSIKFDLIKFDMGFLRRLDERDESKIVLTSLVKMAASLGVDTVCEGVETADQVRFLREIGCSKLQGYYFMRPVPPIQILEKYANVAEDGFEEPREAVYYGTMGRVNLFDLSFLANMDDSVIKSTFDTVPMGIMEVSADSATARFVRNNQPFRDFFKRAFLFDLSDPNTEYAVPQEGLGSGFMKALEQSRKNGGRAFVDEKLADGSIARSFVRAIGKNPVNGWESYAVAVLSITEPTEHTTYAEIARALAADYYSIYVIDLNTNDYIEYSSKIGDEKVSLKEHGEDFFVTARRNAMTRVYEPDRAQFLALFTKENVLRKLDIQGMFTMTYRLADANTPFYVSMKIIQMRGSSRLILGINNIDAYMKQQEEQKRLRQEKISLGRIAALSPDYIVLYTVDPSTGHYTQYNPSNGFEDFDLATQGEDFFEDVRLDAPKAIYPEDMERHLRVLTKENMIRQIRENGVFIHNYRLLLGDKVVPVSLKATMVHEDEGEFIILGVTNNDEGEKYRLKPEEAEKVQELNQSITALLDNMPGMTFTKDAQTGVYLTCNQAFAEYAHKDTPDGVVGLTDAEIFDAVTASHFVEDDEMALSMDRPYTFFEDVPDAVGNQRQFQTTKLKFIDVSGRLCLLGMCQDVTDMVRIQRENVSTREAYEEVRATGVIYNHLAHALARGYTELYYVNMETGGFVEFHTDDERGVLSEARRGAHFFDECRRDAKLHVHPEDQLAFVQVMDRQFLTKALDESKVFAFTYRRVLGEDPWYVQMRVSRMEDDERFVVIAVRDVDELMRQRNAEKRMQEERIVYARLYALAGNYICVYVVDPQTSSYRIFRATDEYQKVFDQADEGAGFFAGLQEAILGYAHPEDRQRILALLTRSNVMQEVERSGFYTLSYRIVVAGQPKYVQMKAAMVEEQEGPRLIVGLYNIDAQVRQEEEFGRRLARARVQANTDSLTGVKNKHAYAEEAERIDGKIAEGLRSPFALVVFDVNNLKRVNDTAGHQAGDQCLREACSIICDIFKHSPVFRVGGDEFVVIAWNRDYERIDVLLEEVRRHNEEASQSGGTVIACGMARYADDACVATVFERADQRMYANKRALKAGEKEL